jgi:hypothetical protein
MNAASGFHLVFCGRHPGHIGTHAYGERGGPNASIDWSYLGTTNVESIAAPIGGNRCKSWVHMTELQELSPAPFLRIVSSAPESGNKNKLLAVKQSPGRNPAFSCERPVGHSGGHTCSGTFGPLGIKWDVAW